jgi:hypothetical protein
VKYAEAQQFANDLRAYADFIESEGPKLGGVIHDSADFSIYLTVTNYERDPETGEWESVVKEEQTKKNLKQFLASVGSCEKVWESNNLKVTKTFGKTVRLVGYMNRSTVCKKVVTGTKVVPAVHIPESVQEITEWVCEDPSLFRLVEGV